MARLLARRLVTGMLTLLLVTLLVFGLTQLSPGDPLAPTGGEESLYRLSPENRAELIRIYHLDQPLHRRYLSWLADLARGDLGRSFRDRRPVASKIGERLGPTLALNGLALLLMVGLAVPIGTLAAYRPNSLWDRLSAVGTNLLFAIPVFWAGLLLQVVLSVRLGWLPLAGWSSDHFEQLPWIAQITDRLSHLILPVVCLSYAGLAYLSRFVRSTLLEGTAGELVVAARARGLSAAEILGRHGFRLAAVPMLTLAGFLVPSIVGGSVIVESVFAIPGLGMLFVESAIQRDLPVLMGLTLLSGAATLAGIVAADLAYGLVDPRIRRG